MPALVAWLLGGLLTIAGNLAVRVLLSLGIGWLTYQGVDVTLTWVKAQAVAAFTGLPPVALGLIGMLKVGQCISILFSALLMRLTLNGLSAGGAISKLVKR